MLLKVEPSNRVDKKYKGFFSNGEVVHFGSKNASDFTIHGSNERKARYIQRHKKNEEVFWRDDPYSPASLSRWVTWEYPSIDEGIKMYNERFFKKKERDYIPTDKKLYNDIVEKAELIYDKPSAYKSGYIVREYKKMFKKKYGPEVEPYIDSKGELYRWFEEDWRNQRGEIGYKKKGDIYRPTYRIDEDTPKTWNELTNKEVLDAIKEKTTTGRVQRFSGDGVDVSGPISDIHTVFFTKDKFTTKKAREWLKLHNLKPIKRVHKTVNTLRYRIREPDLFSSFITKKNKNGVNFVIGFYK